MRLFAWTATRGRLDVCKICFTEASAPACIEVKRQDSAWRIVVLQYIAEGLMRIESALFAEKMKPARADRHVTDLIA
jgi:hypothetical protein